MVPPGVCEERVVRCGHLDLRSEGEFASALRPDAPMKATSADVADAPNTAAETQLGAAARSAQIFQN
jgi:hypothetical protein